MKKRLERHVRESITLLVMLCSLMILITSAGQLDGSEEYLFSRGAPAGTEAAPPSQLIPADTQTPEPEQTAFAEAQSSAPTATPAPTARALPMNDFSVGGMPLQSGYTSEGYADDTIEVKIWKSEKTYKSIFSVAEVKIAHASQLRTAIGGTPAKAMTTLFSTLAKRNQGVVTMNGDFYSARQQSYIVRQSQVLKEKNTGELDLLIIDYAGDFHIYKAAEKAAGLAEMAGNVYQAFSFGPALVIDGEIQEMPDGYPFAVDDPHQPRSAIGQIGELHYVMVVADGRTDYSGGVSCTQLATYMRDVLGCTQAYNLDGGATAAMYYNGAIYNHLTDKGERAMYDIIYFASAAEAQP